MIMLVQSSATLKSTGNTLKRPKIQPQPTTQSCNESVDRDVNQLSGGGCHDHACPKHVTMAA